MDKKYDVTTFILRRRRVPSIADIIKIATIFIKKTLMTEKKLKQKNWRLYIKMQCISVFLDIAKFNDFQ